MHTLIIKRTLRVTHGPLDEVQSHLNDRVNAVIHEVTLLVFIFNGAVSDYYSLGICFKLTIHPHYKKTHHHFERCDARLFLVTA